MRYIGSGLAFCLYVISGKKQDLTLIVCDLASHAIANSFDTFSLLVIFQFNLNASSSQHNAALNPSLLMMGFYIKKLYLKRRKNIIDIISGT